ncbi:hypothetical protein E3P81_04069 [Wallemia ichthyophaga]|nr:hypothetical protein E3P97_04078 [Wallemia ichthyophaga]TIB27783.1 hypothetical protein E3P85_04066 [Wallemia ichthyophaga]TIB43158.1 hypothetical protein E3P82_04077 [Wallemia ichthyophaga]TIB45327.1 hypothetical protein E3P81_04069 [Wallemia ichthyophaga]TIB47168.1 hypothetical protein E3P80_04081 [Wallemia ichthyophaga]
MLRTLVRGAGRGSTKPLVIGDETIDLRAFRNTPGKGYVPDRSNLQGESALSSKLRNRTQQRPQQKKPVQQESGQFDDADHHELLKTLGDRKQRGGLDSKDSKPQGKPQRRANNKQKERHEEEGKDVQRRAAKQHNKSDRLPVDIPTRKKKEERKPKLKEIEIDRMDLSALVFENHQSGPLPTIKREHRPTEVSEDERRKLHMEAVGGEYDRYARYDTPAQRAMSAQKMISLDQRQEMMDNINRITKAA